MSWDLEVIAITNLALLSISLMAFIIYKLDRFRREERLLKRKIEHLNELLDEKSRLPGSRTKTTETHHKSLDSLMDHQMDLLNSSLEMEDLLMHLNSKEFDELKVQFSALKAQSKHAHRLVGELKGQAKASHYRQTRLEETLKEKALKLQVTEANHRELEKQNEVLAKSHERMLDKVEEYEEAKGKLGKTIMENMRLSKEIEEFHILHERQMVEIEELKVANQTQGREMTEDMVNEEMQGLLDETERQLERAERERLFVEEKFLEVVNSLKDQENITDELNRSKTEYDMLEDHFIRLSEKNASNK